MSRLLLLISTSFVAGCLNATPEPSKPPPEASGKVMCEETQEDRVKLASALAKTQDGDVEELDAMCDV